VQPQEILSALGIHTAPTSISRVDGGFDMPIRRTQSSRLESVASPVKRSVSSLLPGIATMARSQTYNQIKMAPMVTIAK
jgi:hypothetical protein